MAETFPIKATFRVSRPGGKTLIFEIDGRGPTTLAGLGEYVKGQVDAYVEDIGGAQVSELRVERAELSKRCSELETKLMQGRFKPPPPKLDIDVPDNAPSQQRQVDIGELPPAPKRKRG